MTPPSWLVMPFVAALPVHILPAVPAVAMTGLWAWKLVRGHRRLDGVTVVLALNYLYWMIRMVVDAPWEELTRYAFWRWQLRIFLAFLPYFWFCCGVFDWSTIARRATGAFLLASGAVVVVGMAQVLLGVHHPQPGGELSGVPVVDATGERWFVGFQRTHAAAGAFYLIPTIQSLALFLFWADRPRAVALTLAAFGVNLFGLAFTKTRAAYLGFAVAVGLAAALLVWRLLRRRYRFGRRGLARLVAVLGLTIAVPVAVPGGLERIASVARAPHAQSQPAPGAAGDEPAVIAAQTASDRLVHWRAAAAFFAGHPVFGIGLGRYPEAFHEARYESELGMRIEASPGEVPADTRLMYHAHSSYLHVASELGVVGLLLFLAFWGWSLVAAAPRGVGGTAFAEAFKIGAVANVIAQLVVGVFDYNWAAPSVMLPLTFVLGLARCLGPPEKLLRGQ